MYFCLYFWLLRGLFYSVLNPNFYLSFRGCLNVSRCSFLLPVLHHLSLPPRLRLSPRLAGLPRFCRSVNPAALLCDNKSSNQTGGWQLPAQSSSLTRQGRLLGVRLRGVYLCAIVQLKKKRGGGGVRELVWKCSVCVSQMSTGNTYIKVGHRLGFISGIISYDSSSGMF